MIAIDDAIKQITRRIKLIDPILTLGFERIPEHSMSIYLPNIPAHIQRRKEISCQTSEGNAIAK